MSGTLEGGRKARDKNYEQFGKDFYRNIGRKGGSAPTNKPKGFATNPELARTAGAKAGEKSRRGLTYMGEEGARRKYIDKNTGEVVLYQYDMQSQKYIRVN